ncbi:MULTISPECIES: 4-alpha-glucanotransferase [unclassified Fusobacterium]|uniref:4-alpha-glucanotransferase n=1 Tax=unclassified Fusobacterium TaxID=2648384 RepID=UPI0026357487|nr:4-alpha-glucanotransferase [Fusobacterium sp.]
MFERSSGILMHISSLPSEYGIGDLGKKAYEFVDFLNESGQKLWQILPLGPTGYGDSPYQSYSAFAGNYLFIDLEEFVNKSYIDNSELDGLRKVNYDDNLDYEQVKFQKDIVLEKIFPKFIENLASDENLKKEYSEFKEKNKFWLEDYALYMTLKEKFDGKPWQKWSKIYKNRVKSKFGVINEKRLEYYSFLQYTFYKQWGILKRYANEKGVKIIGDIPIFVATDSSDTWSNSKIFQFTKSRVPKCVAGCPPDYFSKTGQLWGNVLYDWKELKKQKYRWWIDRVRFCFEIYDIVRIDHFRGFDSFWSIRYREKTAIKGRWKKGPGMDLFKTIEKRVGKVPIIAEDLGLLTPSVKKLLKKSGYPGMKILEFAFDSDDSDYLPHKYEENCVAYTGTHDNDTIVGWYEGLNEYTKFKCDEYLKEWLEKRGRNYWNPIEWRGIETLWSSKAKLVIIQMQDLLGLGSSARMNIPATVGKNWKWRVQERDLSNDLKERLKEVTKIFNRY